MTTLEREQLQRELDAAYQAGTPWVAFNDQPGRELHPLKLHFFTSAIQAEQFCDEANGPDNFADQLFNWDHYIYLSVATLTAELRLSKVSAVSIDIADVARQLAEQQLHLPPGKSMDDLEASLGRGAFFPVAWQRQVDPLHEIADYHVIAHRHEGGQIYEVGHSHRVLKKFDTYTDARAFLDNAVLYNELSDKAVDYVLVGRFHGQLLELDMEGAALPHAGLTLLTACHNYDHGHDYHELHALSKPATLQQYFFAGLLDGKVALFNDKLEPTSIGERQQPFYPFFLNQEYLTTKNANSMNQGSFEYNRDQLLNMGFGEEIAAALHTKMDQNLAEFTLDHVRKFGNDEMHSVLHFSKGDDVSKDITFFNRFDATLKKEGMEDLTQSFFVGQETKFNYTLMERYNMMDGRAAYREQPKMTPLADENGKERMKPTGETYFAWRSMDFKNADKWGNFLPKVIFWDHEKELQKYPIKGIEEKYDRTRIMRPLQRGNKVDIVLLRDGQETPAKVMANPRMMRLDFFDASGQSLLVRKVEKQKLDATEKVELTPQQVRQAAMDKAAEQKQENGQGQAQQQPEQTNSQQLMQREGAEQKAAQEERQEQGQRRRQGVRV